MLTSMCNHSIIVLCCCFCLKFWLITLLPIWSIHLSANTSNTSFHKDRCFHFLVSCNDLESLVLTQHGLKPMRWPESQRKVLFTLHPSPFPVGSADLKLYNVNGSVISEQFQPCFNWTKTEEYQGHIFSQSIFDLIWGQSFRPLSLWNVMPAYAKYWAHDFLREAGHSLSNDWHFDVVLICTLR